MKSVLIVEDEGQIREFVVINFKRAGYEVIDCETGEEALKIIKDMTNIDIAILDIMLPDINGYEVCKEIRKKNQKMGIIMLTARSQELDKVEGLSVGADDYVIKPFSPMELIARADALYRRVSLFKSNKKRLHSGPFMLDIEAQILYKNNNEISLTQIEFKIIKLFIKNSGKALEREDILDKVWGENYFGGTKIVDVNVQRIRKKIEEDLENPQHIKTIWGYGYRWEEGKVI